MNLSMRLSSSFGFNPRSPHGERHIYRNGKGHLQMYVSIHAPRMGSDFASLAYHLGLSVSIHAPRMGSDGQTPRAPQPVQQVSIHAPRMGSDAQVPRRRSNGQRCFNPRSPHGERPRLRWRWTEILSFNPRSPHGERRLFDLKE